MMLIFCSGFCDYLYILHKAVALTWQFLIIFRSLMAGNEYNHEVKMHPCVGITVCKLKVDLLSAG